MRQKKAHTGALNRFEAGVMGFLIKAAFWLSLVIILLPAPEGQEGDTAHLVGTTEAVSLLSAALNDARGFCLRNPDACVTGAQAAQTFGHKAQYATRLLHDLIGEKIQESASTKSPAAKSTARQGEPNRAPFLGADTLTPADMAPQWRGADLRQASLKRS